MAAKIERRRKKGNCGGAAFLRILAILAAKPVSDPGAWFPRVSHEAAKKTRTEVVCLLCVPAPLREHRSFARAHGMEPIPRGAAEGGGRKNRKKTQKGNCGGAAFLRFFVILAAKPVSDPGAWFPRVSHEAAKKTRTEVVCLLCVPAPLREHRSFARAHGMERIPRGAAEGGGRKNRKKTQKGNCGGAAFLRILAILAAKPVSDPGAWFPRVSREAAKKTRNGSGLPSLRPCASARAPVFCPGARNGTNPTRSRGGGWPQKSKEDAKRGTVVEPPFCASLRFLRQNRFRILGRGFRGFHAKPRRRPGRKWSAFSASLRLCASTGLLPGRTEWNESHAEPRRGVAAKIERRRKNGNGRGTAFLRFLVILAAKPVSDPGAWFPRVSHEAAKKTRNGSGLPSLRPCASARAPVFCPGARNGTNPTRSRGGGWPQKSKEDAKRGTVVEPPFCASLRFLRQNRFRILGRGFRGFHTKPRRRPGRKWSAFSACLRLCASTGLLPGRTEWNQSHAEPRRGVAAKIERRRKKGNCGGAAFLRILAILAAKPVSDPGVCSAAS